ncbi:UDP-N-acetylmuramate dehydrogenase [Microbulbifer hydrolyticus]|uniref:UDP-N-acetylenolpyruvoylglucosamine reductase n=1 Tax=Microbulbifer hydrolyticus TaxID=48074 RepID=A0A6P1T8C7_9GAMM|nr:UDP-N-acetylmuramate dehydrogenase [Microbulbifer hydrolyticus]MBB5210472.1 UDP-N-acetylmuramate dehydrogenase [Microbulbifer hydrolyticus]QHQ39048.1 UDP-N-acetylmuramate dehydrogenase [Microbulbifer hydrolyticus]
MIQSDVDLQPYNTMTIAARAKYFCAATSLDDLREALKFVREHKLPILPLGGGSNIVLTGDFPGLALHLGILGLEFEPLDDGVRIRAAAGENWHQLVMHSVDQGYGGLENLALIPGNIGAAPIQNIGAYGVELKDSFEQLTAMDIATGELSTFSAEDCQFGYRDSVFKGRAKDRFLICEVVLKLSGNWQPRVAYPALQHYFSEHGQSQDQLTPTKVANAVIDIRNSKLPNPVEIPNTGSFFKNPVVDASLYRTLKAAHPELVAYEAGEQWKLAAGWLIDQAGWRGFSRGGVGVHDRQALVLVNPGHRCGSEVVNLAREIASDVQRKFGVTLEPEPRFYP